jgi:hypothetical protein
MYGQGDVRVEEVAHINSPLARTTTMRVEPR